MRFEFATSARILFGTGTLSEAAPAARSVGRRALLVLGKSAARAGTLLEKLQAEGVTASLFHVGGEPGVETVIAGVAQARAEGCELVIGLGGGSALDAGKAIAALLTNPGEYDRLRVNAWERAKTFVWQRVLPPACEWLEQQAAKAGR